MATRRRQTFFLGAPTGGGINIGPGALIPAIGIGYANGVASSLSVVTPQAGVKGQGSSTGAIARSRQVTPPPPGNVKGIGYATGQEQTTILLNASYIPKSTGIGTSTGSISKGTTVTPAAGVRGVGTSTGKIGRIKTIISASLVAGTRGVGYATGQLYEINNISDLITAAKGVGTSTGTLSVKVFVSGNVQGQGAGVGKIRRTIPVQVVAGTKGIGSSTGTLRRFRAVNTATPAAIGIGYANGALTNAGLVQILFADLIQPKGIGYSTGAIRRTEIARGAGIGIGYAVAAITLFHEKRITQAQASGQGIATGRINRRILVTPATPKPTGVGTSVGAVRIFINLNFIGNVVGVGTATGRIKRTISLVGVVVGIGYATGTAVKGGSKQILSTPLSTGIGTSTGKIRRTMTLQQLAGKGIGYSVGVLQVNGSTITWIPAFAATLVTPFDPRWFHPATVHTYTVFARVTSGLSVSTRLFNVTDNVPVAGTQMTIISAPGAELESPALSGATFPLLQKDYRAEVGTTPGSAGTIYRARIASKGS